MASLLQYALDWAARGFRVFPLMPGTKDRPVYDAWHEAATNDLAMVRSMWSDPLTGIERDYNIGVDTTGMVVLDIDVKQGAGGAESVKQLSLVDPTLTVQTPSGGLHLYFRGPDSRNRVGFLPGLDIRSHHGYVLAPGSTTDAGIYHEVVNAAIADVPSSFTPYLQPPMTRAEIRQLTGLEIDGEAQRQAAIDYLTSGNTPIATAFQGGNNTTYQVACRVRDFGLSRDVAMELMWYYWNERCEPPWSADELLQIVTNADEYAENAAGTLAPEITFEQTKVEPPVYANGYAVDFVPRPQIGIPPRPWVVDRMLMRGAVSTLVAAGAAGKSTLMLTVALHVAMGRDFLKFKLRTPGKAIVYDAEDDADEMERRFQAICVQFGFDVYEAHERVALISGTEHGITVAKGQPLVYDAPSMDKLVRGASDPDVKLLCMGPLVDMHTAASEDDNVAMSFVMRCLGQVAMATDTAVFVAHHTAKSNAGGAGSAAAGRGAGAIINKSRVAFTLYPMQDEDVNRYNVDPAQRRRYVRLDDAKMNLALESGEPAWLEKKGVTLYNGDEVGVLSPIDMREAAGTVATTMAETLVAEYLVQGTASMSLAEAALALQRSDPLYQKLPQQTVRIRIENAFTAPVSVQGGGVLAIVKKSASGKTTTQLVLE